MARANFKFVVFLAPKKISEGIIDILFSEKIDKNSKLNKSDQELNTEKAFLILLSPRMESSESVGATEVEMLMPQCEKNAFPI